jgi:hypothetical protein
MNDQGVAAVEMKELVFSSSLDAVDPLSPDRSRPGCREFSLQRGMDRLHRGDRFSKRGAAESPRCALYLW